MIDIEFNKSDDESTRYFLPSELLIYNDRVYYGMAARSQFEVIEATQDQLIDSPKQYMTLGTDVGELHQKPLRRTQDPSQSLSQRDALVLYLAHLNYLAEKSLINNGLSADVMRRYAHPAWDDAAVDTNSNAMKRIMAESIVLAKCFADEFEKCMPLSTAKCITRMARNAEDNDLPFELLLSPVYEATAAGAGALMATRRE